MSEGDYEEAQLIEQGTKEVLIPSVRDMGQALEKVNGSVATGARRIAATVPQVDEDAANGLRQAADGTLPDAEEGAGSIEANATTSTPKGPASGPDESGPVDDEFGKGDEGGQPPEGNEGSTTGGTDPVDVVSGQLLAAQLDVALPGVLPLALRRAYASGYRHGQFLGPGWSSTLDQRVVIDGDGIHYLGDDAQTLNYPVPAQPGQPALPAAGARRPLEWDRSADAITVHDPATGLTQHFAPPQDTPSATPGRQVRHLARITDRNGNWIAVTRDGDGVPTRIDQSGGYRIAVESSYGAAGFRIDGLRRIDPEHPDGVPLVRYGYDPAGRLVEIFDSSGIPFVYEYDAQDRIIAWIDRMGYRFEYVYDDEGRVVRTGGEDGLMAAHLAYDTDRRVTTVTDSLGHATEYHYDQRRHLSKTVDPLGAVTLTETDRYGRILSHTDALGHTTGCRIDPQGAPVLIRRPDGTTVEVVYNELGKPMSVTGPDGGVCRYTYDAAGNTLSTTDPAGATTVYGYDDSGALTQVTDALGNLTTAVVDRAGLLLEVTDPLGARWRFGRDAAGRIVSVTDPLGAVTVTAHDGEGRPVARTHPDGTVERWEYDANGNQTSSTDRAGNVTANSYGAFHQVTSRTDPSGARHAFTHDTELRLVEVTDPRGLTWNYTFDQAGNLTGERDFNDRELRYGYDAAGRLSRRVNGAGEVLELSRDALGRVVEQRGGGDQGTSTIFEYDANGMLSRAANPDAVLEFTRDPLGRVVAESVDGRVLTRSHDPLGRRVTRTTPSGRASAWRYDAAGRPEQLSAGERQISFGHDAAGHETYRWIGTETALTNEWDRFGRLTTRRLLGVVTGPEGERSAELLQQRSWTYRPDGVPESVSDTADGLRQLTADPLGRVTAVRAETWSEQYAYDASGNLTLATDSRDPGTDAGAGTGTGAGVGTEADAGASAGAAESREFTGTLLRRSGRTDYTYDAQGRLIRALRRTLSGTRRIRTYRYDAQDRLVEATNPEGERWRYTYDPLGRRVAKERLGEGDTVLEAVRFSWDGAVLAEQEHVRAGDVPVTVTAWDYEPGSWTPLTQDRRSYFARAPQELVDQQFHAIVTDLIGTPTELVTAEGEIAWRRRTGLWGERLPEQPGGSGADCPLGFPGQYHDRETGLEYNNQRYYDPPAGRYTTPDPLGLGPAPNPHAYVVNPLAWSDPLGLDGEGGGFTDLYHATNKVGATSIRTNGVDPSFGPRPMDFGNGFYTTRDYAQAEDWATRRFGDDGVVLHFKVPDEQVAGLNTKTFEGDSQELRDFVKSFRSDRSGTQVPPYDMVEGPMLRNPQPFLKGKAPKWSGNQVVFYGSTGPILDHALQ